MKRYDVTFTLDENFSYKLDEQVLKLVGMHVETDRFRTLARMTVEAENEKNAILEAERRLEDFLGLYYVYSTDGIQIMSHHQITLKDLNTSETTHHVSVGMMPQKEFNQDDFMRITSNYYEVIAATKNEYLRIALDYFRMGRFESRLSNKIIDYFVALEALYSKNDEKTEIGYRLANRISTVLGKNAEDRKEIMLQTRSLYNKRSKAVHGSAAELQPKDLSPLYRWVRESILRFLVLSRAGSNHEAIVDEIDSAMLDNSIRDRMRKETESLIGLVLD